MSSWIDTHAHIYLEDFKEDREEMMVRCRENQVSRIYMPNIDHTSVDSMMEVEARYPEHCLAMMGLHPCSVNKDFQKELYLVEEWLSKRRFSAIGEIGTDLYWDKTFWEQQREAFEIQVTWAKKYKLPIVIHCRESLAETISIVKSLHDENLKGVFHCFTGSIDEANEIVSMGFHIGLGGVVTFKNGGLDKVVPGIDLKGMVLETDSPYLSPVPHRGKRNEPSYIPLIAQRIAELKKITIEELQSATFNNASALYNS
jgi:TatD DNase family protein